MKEKIKLEKGAFEATARSQGLSLVGTDEVGRGCIAGPVYAAAVSLDYESLFKLSKKDLSLIRDSKTLSSAQRQYMLPLIKSVATAYAIGIASVNDIETFGIVPATFSAMTRALEQLPQQYDLLLIDGRSPIPDYPGEQRAFIKGDSLIYAIAAASILAKEARDQHMKEADTSYPGYGFAQHVGYGTKQHLQALADIGICPLHRRNFAPIRNYVSLEG
ncbi:MAG: ribonuclease HII [Oligoflexus sp.]